MSNPAYFCYTCNREDLKCEICGGEFIEELQSAGMGARAQQRGAPTTVGEFASLFNTLLSNRQSGDANRALGNAASPFQNIPAGGPEVAVQAFLDNIMRIGVQLVGEPNVIAHGSAFENIDQIVTNLLNNFDGENVQAGLTADDIKRIPEVTVTQKHVDNTTQCTTCMDTFKKDEVVLQLNCSHIFHRPCLIPWMERHSTCPICRQVVDPSVWPQATAQDDLPLD